jgi:hypothetical protein
MAHRVVERARLGGGGVAIMSTRLLLSGLLKTAVVRRKRMADGALYAVATVSDSDRGMRREWRVFANDPAVIEQLEEMAHGEPIACSGPFYAAIDGGDLVYRMTIEALVDVSAGKNARVKSPRNPGWKAPSSISLRARRSRRD